MLYPIEGDRWILTVAGVGRDYPPTDEAGFLEFTRSLRSSILYEAIKDAQPLSSIYGYRRTENHRRHYERYPWPEGFVAVGDAVCAFNPIYAQGHDRCRYGCFDSQLRFSEQHQRQPNGDLTGLAQRRKLVKVNATPDDGNGRRSTLGDYRGSQPAGSTD